MRQCVPHRYITSCSTDMWVQRDSSEYCLYSMHIHFELTLGPYIAQTRVGHKNHCHVVHLPEVSNGKACNKEVRHCAL